MKFFAGVEQEMPSSSQPTVVPETCFRDTEVVEKPKEGNILHMQRGSDGAFTWGASSLSNVTV